MPSKTQHGCLVLADISGYSSYVAQAGLKHAHEILSELMEFITGRLTSALSLSKLEGDPDIALTSESTLARAEALLELIEATVWDWLKVVRRTAILKPAGDGTRREYHFRLCPPAPKWLGRLLSKMPLGKEAEPLSRLAPILAEKHGSIFEQPAAELAREAAG
jgi:hypothetical protein